MTWWNEIRADSGKHNRMYQEFVFFIKTKYGKKEANKWFSCLCIDDNRPN